MGCRSIFHTPLFVLALLFSVSVSPVRGEDFSVETLVDAIDVAVYEVTGNYDAKLLDGSSNVSPRQEIAKKFYTTHSDQYDFLVIFSNFDFRMPQEDVIAFYLGVQNDVQGIGIDLTDHSSQYGSDGVLQGTIDMGNLNSLASAPLDPDFSKTMGTLSHELLHRWSAHVSYRKPDNSISRDLLGRDDYHWNFLLDTAGSLELGNRWLDNGNGTFTSLTGRRYFSPLDLYLMGLIDRSEVPPMLLIDNPEIDPERLPEPGVTIEGTAQYITIDDIIAAEGERVPGTVDSQKSFKIGCIFVTRPGTYSEADLVDIRNVMRSWTMWFSGLTDGRAKITLDNNPFHDLPQNPGPSLPPIDPRTAPPEINDGLAWLLSNQNADGSWQDSQFTAERDTITVLHSLLGYAPGVDAIAGGLSWLEGIHAFNLDYLARKIELLGSQDADTAALTAELLARQNPDGGWGSNRNYLSNPADTALALQALLNAGQSSPAVADPAVEYLLNEQNGDSGWGAGEQSDIQTSIDVIKAFIPFREQQQLAIPIQNALAWVYGKQNPDGGFGNSPSTIYSTAKALIALKQIGVTSDITGRAVSYLLGRQEKNGSWLSSAYQTALAVQSVWVATREPDLSVSTEYIVPAPATVAVLPSALQLSVTVHNSGMTDAEEAKVVLYEGTTDGSGKIDETLIPLAGQTSETIVFNTVISDGRPHHYYVIVDPDNLIKESSEQNNAALRIIYPEATYDFAVFSEEVSVAPAAGNVFEPLTISATVTNNGTVDAYSVPINLITDHGSGPIITASQTIDLPAGKNSDFSFSWVPEIEGTGIALSIVLDPHDIFAEVNEDNNAASITLDINSSTKPELTLSYSDISFDPDPALKDGSTTLKAGVINKGFSPAANVRVEFYELVTGTQENIYLGSVVLPAIGVGERAEAVLDGVNNPVSGKRVINVVVDPRQAIDEINEDNNSAFRTLQVLDLPDVEVVNSGISFIPEAPHEGEPFAVNADLYNRGEQPVLNVPVEFYADGSLAGTFVVPEIAAGGKAAASIILDARAKAGIVEFEVIVDPDGTISEQSRENNRAMRSVGIQNGDFWLSHSYISPNGDGIKDSTEFGYRLPVQQDVKIVIVNEKGEVVREYAGPEYTSITFVSLSWDGLDSKGRVVADGQYRVQILAASGSVLTGILVTVDNNRSSFMEAVGTPYLYTAEIGSLLNDYKYRWFPDDSGIAFHLETKRLEYDTGIYSISPTGGDLQRLVPEEWSENADPLIGYRYLSNQSDCNATSRMNFECDQINPGFAMSADGYSIGFILEKYEKPTGRVMLHQLWAMDRFGENLTLLDSFDLLENPSYRITDIFPSPDGTHIAYKLYDQITDNRHFAIIRSDGTGKTTYVPGWQGFDYDHRLTWAPDGQKLVFSDATHMVMAYLDGTLREILPIANPTVFFDWFGSERILVRDMNTWYGIMDIWSIDLNAPESPLLIAEQLEHPDSAHEYGSCLKWGGNQAVSVPPLAKNGDFIAGAERNDLPFVNYVVCNMDGQCQDSDFIEVWGTYLSLPPDSRKIVVNDDYGILSVFDRDTLQTTIFETGIFGSDNYFQEQYNLPLNYTVKKIFEDIDVGERGLEVQKWNWFDSETFLAKLAGDRHDLLVVDIKNEEKIILPTAAYNYDAAFSPDKHYITISNTSNYSNFILGSLLNLTADLRASKSESAVTLTGIAADLNFSHWKLEYADRNAPDDWHILVHPSDKPVVDELFTNWVPPYEGSFLVRLTVADKAGNEDWSRTIVTWGKDFSVTDIHKTGELFSPNGDGVKDTIGLNYTVHEPLHLELSVYDEDGILVKTFYQDHVLPGEYGIVWDGRNEAGGIVPDGRYSIRIFDFEFFFHVDTTPPEAGLEFGPIICESDKDHWGFRSQLSGLAVDDHMKFWSVSYADQENLQEWIEIKSGGFPFAATNNENELGLNLIQGFGPRSSIIPVGLLNNTSFRLVAEDLAGNQSVVGAQFNEELPVLYEWDGIPIDLVKNELGECQSSDDDILPIRFIKPGLHSLTVVETLQNSIASANVQYRMHMQWYDAEEVLDPPEGEFELIFDSSQLVPELVQGVRVKIVDEGGIVYYSNSVVFNQPVFKAEVKCVEIYGKAYPMIVMDVSLPENLQIVTFQATVDVNGLTSWEKFEEYSETAEIPYRINAPFPEELPQGYAYPLRIVGIGESGKEYISNEMIDPPELCSPGRPPGGDYSLSTRLEVRTSREKTPCNTVNNGTVEIFVIYRPDDEPKTLPDTVRYYLEENGIWRLLKEFTVAVDGWGRVIVETESLAEGEHEVRVDLVTGDSVDQGFRTGSFVIDRTMPKAQITYPALSAPFCARTEVSQDGVVSRYVDIEGIADDENGIQGYSIIYGLGSKPDRWLNVNRNTSCSPEYANCSYLSSEERYGQLGYWKVTGLEQTEYSLQLMVTDQSGNTSCSYSRARIGMNMSLDAAADNKYLSPNGDNIQDTVSVAYEVKGHGVVDISVLQGGVPIRNLLSDHAISGSGDTIVWDGLDDSGSIVPDGSYQIQVAAKDSCGNEILKKFTAIVDNTAPAAMIFHPGTEDQLGVITEVKGTANDLHLDYYQLHVQGGSVDDVPVLLNKEKIVVENDILGTWNTFSLEGNWSLILTAVDLAGNRQTTQVPVRFGARTQLIRGLTAAPKVFSPNSDGKFESTAVNYELTDRSNITIAVKDTLGNNILTESIPDSPSGIHEYLWTGLNAGGAGVPDGVYTCTVTAESINPPFVVHAETITLATDTVSPVINITAPADSSYYQGEVTVQGTLNDPNLKEYSISFTGAQQTDFIKPSTVGSEIVFSENLDLPEGAYSVQVDARDAGENSSSLIIPFTIDKTRPRIEIVSPGKGESFGGENSIVALTGIIEEPNPQSFTVQYGAGMDPVQWFDLTSGDKLPPADVIATWNVGSDQGIADGDYTIRVVVVDKAGWQSEARVGIRIDNTPPELGVLFPEEGGYAKEACDVTGVVSDLFLQEYFLELGDASCAAASNWSVLRTGTQTIQNGKIVSFAILPPDGVYCMRLTARDTSGNFSETKINFTVDTIPPVPPVLEGSLAEAAVSLIWLGNGEQDLAGFNLYRNNKQINLSLLSETTFVDDQLGTGEYVYTVRAVDQAGWESRDSNQVSFTVDFTPPEAVIHSPRGGSLASNYIDIIGRAYSEDDFKEYRVAYGLGDTPQTWLSLRTSPVPVPYGELVRWDVLSLDDGLYTIKLETEDINGNTNERRTTVTVDNTPPAAPLLLAAEPDGASVDLGWQANAEPDLAGYLVFRNGQLANVSGTVVGNLAPYLITELSYRNIDVPDGTQEYYLVAVDNAGNMSEQSNSIEVDIDTHAPHLHIVTPSDGLEFDNPIPVKADTEDSDISTVQFQYLSGSETVWTDLGAVLTQRPYVVSLDPAALGWEYGSFRIRAVGVDLGGLADEMPEEVLVQYRNVTPPKPPAGIFARVNGGIISLTWDPNQEEDLSGYNVYMGGSSVQRNTALLAGPQFIDPSQFANGEYTYGVTAVDTAGNESVRAAATARVFTPVLNQLQGPVATYDITVSGSTDPGASVEVFTDLISGAEVIGAGQSEADGRFTISVTLTKTSNSLFAVATDAEGNISRPSQTIAAVYSIPPAAPTGVAATVTENDVVLAWNPNSEPDLAGYNVYRTMGADWQKINISPVVSAGYTDPELKNGIYTYRVTSVNRVGLESGPSNETAAVIEKPPPAPPLNLTAAASPEGGAIDLCWEASADPAAGYLIYRSLVAGGPYGQADGNVSTDLCYHDSGLPGSTQYFYTVRSVDFAGNESINSNEASAITQDAAPPDKPVILLPTVSGRPYQSRVERVDIAGLAKPGAGVELFHDQEWIGKVEAMNEQVHENNFLSNADLYETVATPDGKIIYYSQREKITPNIYEYHTYRQDIVTGLKAHMDQIPEGSWGHRMSPDGSRIAYNYEDETGWVRIGIYDIATDTAAPLTSDADVDEWEPAWSSDGTKVVFDADRGDGLYDIWVHDLASGSTSRVTHDFEGFYPEFSSDGQLIAFLAGSSSLYVVNSDGGVPIPVADDVDLLGFYPSVEWSPQGSKLAYTANLDGTDDIYVLDTDTGETSRLTETGRAEMDLQWSPDGKHIAYHVNIGSISEIRMVPVDGSQDPLLLHTIPGKVASDFLWQPAGIFYRSTATWYYQEGAWKRNSYLHRIIPPGTFTFESVGLHVGQNVFTAIAEDVLGNVSKTADEIVVSIDESAMPDLEVLDQDILVLPGAPIAGEETILSTLVWNKSGVPVENVSIDMYLWDAEDNIELIHSEIIPFLEAHSQEWVSVNWDSTGKAGTNTIFVIIDTYNGIAESHEDNNFASASFYVAEEVGITFETTLNGSEFRSDEVVTIDVALYNSGPERDVRLTVTVEDENSATVEELAAHEQTLPYGANETVGLLWKAGSVFAGTYQVRTVLADADGGLLGEQVKPFTVLADVAVSASLATNSREYGPDEQVLFGLFLANLGTNSIIPELMARLTVSDGAQVLYAEEHTLVNLYPGEKAAVNTSWNTSRNAPGMYRGSVEVYADNALVAEISADFVIIPVMDIAGTVSVDPKVIFQGGGVKAGFSITSSGNVAPGDVLLKLLVLDTRDWTLVASHEQQLSLDMNETMADQHPFAGLDLDHGVYQVLLQSFHQDATRNLAGDTFTVRDSIPPVVSVLSPLDGSVLSDAFNLSVAAVDGGTGVALVEYRVDEGAWLPMPLVNPATGRYASRWMPVEADEGAHMIWFRAADHAGNVSRPVESAVVIQPRVEMTTAINRASYAMNEDVAIEVELVNTAWQKQVHLAVLVETQDGAVVARLTDENLVLGPDAGQTFNPVWNTGAVDAGSYWVRATLTKSGTVLAEKVAEFAVEKVFALTGTLTLSDTSVPPGEPLRGDWTISSNGNFNVTGLIVENILADQVPAQLRIWTETVDLAKGQTLSGSFLIDTQGLATGSYQVTLKTRYETDSFDLAAAQFVLADTVPPVVTILSPLDGTLINGPVEVAASATDDASGMEGVEYRIDQGQWQPLPVADPAAGTYKSVWSPTAADEGARTVSFRGRDRVGNISDPVSVIVTVELCRAFEELTGSLQVKPSPLYYSRDAVLEYTLANQCNRTLNDLDARAVILDPLNSHIVHEETTRHNLGPGSIAAGSFTVSTLLLDIGKYTVQLQVSQAEKPGRILAETTFEILPAVEVDNVSLDQINLLVWLNNGEGSWHDDKEDDHGEHGGDDECDEYDDDSERKEVEHEWRHQSPICGEDCSSSSQIVSVLGQAADYYLVVCDRTEFEQELRNPIYTDFMIVGDKHQLTGHHAEELRERIYSGSGLISFGWSAPGDHLHDDEHGHKEYSETFLGVKRIGLLSKIVPPVNLEESPVTEAGTLNLPGQLQKVETAADTIVAGWISVADKDHCREEDDDDDDRKQRSGKAAQNDHDHQTKQYPVLVLHEYGLGRTVFAGFDLCDAFDDRNDSQLADLLIQSLGYVHRSDVGAELVPHLIKEFGLEVASPGQDLDLTVKGTCPSEIMLYDQAHENWVKDYPWISTYQVNAGETALLPYYVLASDQEGTFTCEFKTGADDGGQYILFDTLIHEFEVLKDRARRLQEAITAVKSLDVTEKGRPEKRNILKYLRNVEKRPIMDGGDTEKNIHDIEKAVNELLHIDQVDIAGIRLQLDILLRIEQGRNYLFE